MSAPTAAPSAVPAVPVAEVRLSGALVACDVLTAILAAFPGVTITGQSAPRRNRRGPGHRLYLTVRLCLPEGDLS